MFFSLLRVIKFAFQDLLRNFSLSIMTIFILVLMLLSVNTLLFIRVLTGQATTMIKEQVDISIYFHHESTDQQILRVRDEIAMFPEVVETKYYTADQVLLDFRKQHADNPDIMVSLEELDSNPFGPTMVVRTREPGDYIKIIDALDVPEYQEVIESKTFADSQKTIERVSAITAQVEKFSLALSILFAAIAFLIIFNMVRVAIFTQRKEISIKKLVGATNWFVSGPYIIEALIFSIFAVVVTYVLMVIAIGFMEPYIAVVFGQQNVLTNYLNNNIISLLGIELIAVFVLTVVSSMLAMRRYLKT